MWFPNKMQWAVMWIGLVLLSLDLGNSYGYGPQEIAPVLLIIGATVLIVWMLEDEGETTGNSLLHQVVAGSHGQRIAVRGHLVVGRTHGHPEAG